MTKIPCKCTAWLTNSVAWFLVQSAARNKISLTTIEQLFGPTKMALLGKVLFSGRAHQLQRSASEFSPPYLARFAVAVE